MYPSSLASVLRMAIDFGKQELSVLRSLENNYSFLG